MTDITIPREAEEAGKDIAFAWLRSHMEDDVRVQQMTDEELTELVSAACIAMLKSWPGMLDSWSVFEEERQIILPLPQENGNE